MTKKTYLSGKKTAKTGKNKRAIIEITLTPLDNARLINLCGQYNNHLKQIEKYLDVSIYNRENIFKITGDNVDDVQKAERVLQDLFAATQNDSSLTTAEVHLYIQSVSASENKNTLPAPIPESDDSALTTNTNTEPHAHSLTLRTPKLHITPRGTNQINYVKNILKYDIIFGVGPAGTGKTYLAVACAVTALEREEVERIVLVRPVVEAGEHLGFLPGDISQKVDPYLRPLYDALYDMLGAKQVEKLLATHAIEIAPLAFMRGRTLNASFIILDESQNSTPEQMKMFLTRIGFGSKAVITGDITQIDLNKGKASGLVHSIKILEGIKELSFNYFAAHDVVRHPLVQRIINAYAKHEPQKNV